MSPDGLILDQGKLNVVEGKCPPVCAISDACPVLYSLQIAWQLEILS